MLVPAQRELYHLQTTDWVANKNAKGVSYTSLGRSPGIETTQNPKG